MTMQISVPMCKKLESEKDVQELITKVKTDYEAAQESDPSLAEFLQGLGEDASASADAGTMLTVTEDCNVRASADSEGEVIGGFFLQERKLKRKGRKATGYRLIMMDRPVMSIVVC